MPVTRMGPRCQCGRWPAIDDGLNVRNTRDNGRSTKASRRGWSRPGHGTERVISMQAQPTRSLDERFWSKVAVGGPEDCWVWQGGKTRGGYGTIAISKRPRIQMRAHRQAWVLTHGPIPEGLWVLHHCDNRPCVNPAHLFLGTAADNTADMFAKGRASVRSNEASTLARLTDAQVADIRRLYDEGVPSKVLAVEYGILGTYVTDLVRGIRRPHPDVPVRRRIESTKLCANPECGDRFIGIPI